MRRVNHYFHIFGTKYPKLFSLPFLEGETADIKWWVNGHPKYDCVAANLNVNVTGALYTVDCDKKLPFYCIKDTLLSNRTYPRVSSVNVSIIPGHLTPMSMKEAENVKLQCKATAWIGDENITLTEAKHGIRYAWTKDGLYFGISTDFIMPGWEQLESRETTVYREQGTYGCQVLLPGTSTWFKSSYVTIKLKDLTTFIATLVNFIPYDEANDGFSTIGSPSFSEKVKEFMTSWIQASTIPRDIFRSSFWDISSLWHDPISGSTIKLLLFVHFNANLTKNVENGDSLIYELKTNLTTALSNLNESTFSPPRRSFLINQTDHCTSYYSYANDVKWLQTNVLFNNISQPACLNENFELYKRKCLLDFTQGPYWEELDQSKCASRSKFSRFSSYKICSERFNKTWLPYRCPPSFNQSGRMGCTKYYNFTKTWDEAFHQCLLNLSYLLNSFGQQMALEPSWIRMKKREGVYRYVKSHPSDFSLNWINRANSYNDNEDCVAMNGRETFDTPRQQQLLNIVSAKCSDKYSFYCYSPMSPPYLLPVTLGSRNISVSIHRKMAYEVFPHKRLSWSQAEEQCFLSGGSLVNLLDEEIFYHLAVYISKMEPRTEGVLSLWLGLRKHKSGIYKWTKGEELSYELWHKNTVFTTIHQYAYVDLILFSPLNWDAHWSLSRGDEEKGFICEYPFSSMADIEQPQVELQHSKVDMTGVETQFSPRFGHYPIFKCKYNGLAPSSIVFYKDDVPLLFVEGDQLIFERYNFQEFLGVDGLSLSYLQGYYWCEGISLFSKRIFTSNKLLYRKNSRGSHEATLVCQMTVTDKNYVYYRTTPEVPQFDLNYNSFLKNYTNGLRDILESIKELSPFLVLVQVTKIKPIGNNLVKLHFNLYAEVGLQRKKRQETLENSNFDQNDFTGTLKQILLKALVPRAESPENYPQDRAASWLRRHKVSARSILVRDTRFCEQEETKDKAAKGGILLWPKLPVGQATRPIQLCSTSDGAPVIRRCLGNFTTGAFWSDVIGRCDGRLSNITIKLKNLSESLESSSILSSNLTNLTAQTNKLQAVDIGYIADIVNHISEASKSIPSNVASNLLESVSNVLDARETSVATSQDLLNTSMRMISSVDEVLDKVEINNSVKNVRIERPNVAVEVWMLNKENSEQVVGIADLMTDGEEDDIKLKTLKNDTKLDYSKTGAAVILPNALFKNYLKDSAASEERNRNSGGFRLSFVVYKNGNFFNPKSHTDGMKEELPSKRDRRNEVSASRLNSAVIAASVKGKKIENLSPPLKLVFNPSAEIDKSVGRPLCVFWDMSANDGYGNWSSKGCKLLNNDEISSFGRLTCVCDHLTNFAVIVDLYGQESISISKEHKLVLDIITYVGCALSIIGLSLTILTFALFKKWRKSLTNQIHVNLAVSLLLSIIVFVLGTEKSWHRHQESCILVATLLHYFLLASFLWMLVETVKHYLMFVAYMKSYVPSFMKKSLVVAWGTPVIIVITTASVDYKHYDGGQYYCWMALKGFYFSFLLPMGVIMLVNVTLFTRIIYALSFDKQRKKIKLRTNQPDNKDDRMRFYAAVGIFILSGVTWTFAFFAVSDARLPFQYLFCIFNSLQGFFIFILMVMKRKSARTFWEVTIQKCLNRKYEEGSAQYSSSGNPMRSGYSHETKTGISHLGTSNSSTSSGLHNGVAFSRKINAVKVLPS